MMTTVYPSAAPTHFQDHRLLFQGNKLEVKQEPMDDAPLHDTPVDMTVRENSVSLSRHRMSMAAESINLGHRYAPYSLPSQHHCHSLMLPKHPREMGVPTNDVSISSHSADSRSPLPHSEMSNSFQMKGSDGKLTIPPILSKDGMGSSFHNELMPMNSHQRAKREFVPDNKKDEGYWSKRLKNNDSARRSRVKRKALEKMMESRLLELQKENIELRHEMEALKRRFGIEGDNSTGTEESHNESVEITNRLISSYTSSPSSTPPPTVIEVDKMNQDDDLDQQRSGSEDSRSNDDSRMYNVGALNHIMGPGARDRTDSMGSSTSSMGSSTSGGGHRMSMNMNRNFHSSRAGSQSPHTSRLDLVMRTDKSGALDLTSDNSNRSTPARDSSSPESCASLSASNSNVDRRYSSMSNDSSGQEESSSSSSNCSSSSTNNMMKSIPLKCRWKKEMKSVHGSGSPIGDDPRD